MSHDLLVIDDAVIHRKILCRIGEKLGFETAEAASYDEAAGLLRRQSFDCITLDLSLGDRAGVEILALLSEIGFQGPVIIISGSDKSVCDDTVRIGNSLDLNLCTPIQKPVDLSALRGELTRIAQYVGLAKLAHASH